jgi:hypothetical protein
VRSTTFQLHSPRSDPQSETGDRSTVTSDKISKVRSTSNETDNGCIVVKRRNIVHDVVRSYTVFVDDQAVGKMWAFQTKAFSAPPGPHVLQLKITSGRSCSDVFQVDVPPGERLVFRTHFRGLKNFLTLPLSMSDGAAARASGAEMKSKYYEWPWIRIRLE